VLPPPGDTHNKYAFNSDLYPKLLPPDWEAEAFGRWTSTGLTQLLTDASFDSSFQISGFNRTSDAKSFRAGTNILRQKFTYTAQSSNGLPANNSDFGQNGREVVLTVTGDLSKTQRAKVWLFFPKTGENHPRTNEPAKRSGTIIPNWYYYWHQIGSVVAGASDVRWGGLDFDPMQNRTGFTYFDTVENQWISEIWRQAGYAVPRSGYYNGASGIDLFAHLLRHEQKHHNDMTGWWGLTNDRNDTADPDGDYIPGNGAGVPTEQSLTIPANPNHSGHYSPSLRATFMDHFDYGLGWSDAEDWAVHTEAVWTNGSADAEDWSAGDYGKQ
jgi:hypothetical protein